MRPWFARRRENPSFMYRDSLEFLSHGGITSFIHVVPRISHGKSSKHSSRLTTSQYSQRRKRLRSSCPSSNTSHPSLIICVSFISLRSIPFINMEDHIDKFIDDLSGSLWTNRTYIRRMFKMLDGSLDMDISIEALSPPQTQGGSSSRGHKKNNNDKDSH